jgi:hypothetical protein
MKYTLVTNGEAYLTFIIEYQPDWTATHLTVSACD